MKRPSAAPTALLLLALLAGCAATPTATSAAQTSAPEPPPLVATTTCHELEPFTSQQLLSPLELALPGTSDEERSRLADFCLIAPDATLEQALTTVREQLAKEVLATAVTRKLTSVGGIQDGYSLEITVQVTSTEVVSQPGPALGTTNLDVAPTGSITITNTTPGREFLGFYLLPVWAHYPAGTVVCSKGSEISYEQLLVRTDGSCDLHVANVQFDPLDVDASQTVAIRPFDIEYYRIPVSDEEAASAKLALSTPVYGFTWINGVSMTGHSQEGFASTCPFNGDVPLLLTAPAGNEALFCS